MEASALERELRERFGAFDWLYETGNFARAGDIARAYLGLRSGTPLPFVFPHGVDTGENPEPEDVDRAEPVYLAVREDIGAQAAALKPVLNFPHPWLLLPKTQAVLEEGEGTLFIGAPSGPDNNENLYAAIQRLDLPKPWGIMLKFRGLDPADFEWWEARGFVTHTAGTAASIDFYPNQRAALMQYRTIAVSYLSTIAVFAALLGRQVALVPGAALQFVTGPNSDFVRHDRKEEVGAAWSRLLSDDREVRTAEAKRLLGQAFLAPPTELRARISASLATVKDEYYLPSLPSWLSRRQTAQLLRRKVPVHKLLPNPFRTVAGKLAWQLGWSRIGVISGNELAHFGLADGEPYSFTTCRSRDVGRRIGLGEGPKKSLTKTS